MRGIKAKRIRAIANSFEPSKVKHGQRMYITDPKTGARKSIGFRRVYQAFKKAYKEATRETYKQVMANLAHSLRMEE